MGFGKRGTLAPTGNCHGPQLPLKKGSAEGARRFPGEMEAPTCSPLLGHCFPLTPFTLTQRGLRSLQGSPTQHGGVAGVCEACRPCGGMSHAYDENTVPPFALISPLK